jgi:O-antigen/teichoic acid export membrane protein
MLKQLLRDSVFYILPRVVAGAVGIILVPLYSRFLPPAEYGVVDLLSLFSSFISVTVALEIAQGVAIYFAEAQTDEEKSLLASTAFWFSLTAYSLFLVVALIFSAPLSAWLIGSTGTETIFRLGSVSIWLHSIYYLAGVFLRWQLRPRQYALVQVIYTLIYAGSSILLVAVLRTGVIGVVVGQIVGALVGAVLVLRFNRGLYRRVFDRVRLAAMLRFSIPLVPSSLGVIADAYVDRIALRALMTLADIGVYGLGLRIASFINIFMLALQTALSPLVIIRQREPDTPAQLARVFHFFVAAALLVFLGLSLYAPELFALFIAPAYWDAIPLIPWLVPATLLSNMHVFAPGTIIAKRTAIFSAINVGGALLNLALNFALIPLIGIQGPAVATFIAAAAAFLAHLYYNQKYYPVPYQWGRVLPGAAAAAALYLVGSRLILPAAPLIAIKLALLAALAVVVVALRLIAPDDVRRIQQRLTRRFKTASG